MATLGIDGLASGLDTTAIITQLMQIEAAPQTLLKSKQTTTQNVVTALQAINTKVKSLAEAAASAATPRLVERVQGDLVRHRRDGDHHIGCRRRLRHVLRRRRRHSSGVALRGGDRWQRPRLGHAPGADRPQGGWHHRVRHGGIELLDDLAAAINGGSLGATATVVRVAGGDTPQYRLQITSTETGTDGAVEALCRRCRRRHGRHRDSARHERRRHGCRCHDHPVEGHAARAVLLPVVQHFLRPHDGRRRHDRRCHLGRCARHHHRGP
ncbi:flagellar cap protein FliD N-terminal domain-containing protein [Demequina litorisediminis]|uniref:flagellar cap protein FliD N-terminal domain-containing protein n=1 Tax=Demequina litorisediminis TaxID=1849022 RepID=UPI0024E0449A|nr:flagellar cap protein FliD N-terminal domain-containing protein [Demequina litorisediminis]